MSVLLYDVKNELPLMMMMMMLEMML